MASQAAQRGLVPGRHGKTVFFKPIASRNNLYTAVQCTASRRSKAGGLRVNEAGAALLGCFTVLPQKALAGELMVFDSAPEISVPSLPAIPVDVASKLPNISLGPIQQVSYDMHIYYH